MNKLNWYFYKVWLPLQCITLGLLFTVNIDWTLVLVSWFILGPVATGVGLHRLFAHRSFTTYKPVEYILGYFATLSAYAPILFWVAEHQYHHKYSDTDKDPSSPTKQGFWYSFLYWRFLKENLNKILILHICSKTIMRDKFLMFLNNNFTLIIWAHVILLWIIDPSLLLSLMLLPIFIESLRVNIVNSVSHYPNIPFNYRNHPSQDNSYNNIVVGYLTFGFGWHNNHHQNPRKLIIQDKWWELDIEGYLGKLLSKSKENK